MEGDSLKGFNESLFNILQSKWKAKNNYDF